MSSTPASDSFHAGHSLGKIAPTIYQNGRWLSHEQAGYDVQDRGVLFADGLYEVVRYDHGRGFRLPEHIQRLRTGLRALNFPGVDLEQLAADIDTLIHHNDLTDARVYVQITRGVASRGFVIRENVSPTITMLAYAMPKLTRDEPLDHGRAIVVEDQRWARCDLKTTMLMPASLAKTQAVERGANEAIFLRQKPLTDQSHITEGASTNVFAVIDGTLWTHPLDQWVLPGVTRGVVLEAADALGIEVIEAGMTYEQLLAADEVFVCSTTQFSAMSHVDDKPIGNGEAGMVTCALYGRLLDVMLEATV